MLKISLYHDFYVALHTHINPYRYRKDPQNRVNSLPTSRTGERFSGKQKPCFPIESLQYAANRALTAIGTEPYINFAHVA